jgi:hypothetical protein
MKKLSEAERAEMAERFLHARRAQHTEILDALEAIVRDAVVDMENGEVCGSTKAESRALMLLSRAGRFEIARVRGVHVFGRWITKA